VHPLQAPELGDALSSQVSSVCSGTSLWRNRMTRAGQGGGEQDRRRVVETLAQLTRVVGHGDRVQVDDAEDAFAALLAGYYWAIAPM